MKSDSEGSTIQGQLYFRQFSMREKRLCFFPNFELPQTTVNTRSARRNPTSSFPEHKNTQQNHNHNQLHFLAICACEQFPCAEQNSRNQYGRRSQANCLEGVGS